MVLNHLTKSLFYFVLLLGLEVLAQPPSAQNMPTPRDFQHDPKTLLEAIRSPHSGQDSTLAFDFDLTLSEVLGAARVTQLTRAQRSRLAASFNQLVAEEIKRWRGYVKRNVVQYAQEKEQATMAVRRGNELVRVTMLMRNGHWQVVEVENLDEDLALFADAFGEALNPGTGRAHLLAIPRTIPFARAVRRMDSLIAANGEQPSLLLMKALLLGRKQYEEAEAKIQEWNYGESVVVKGRNRGQSLLQRIRGRWPDYAPAHYFYATEEFIHDPERKQIIAALQHYTQLRPFDPRGWYWLGHEEERQKHLTEAERAFQEAIRLAPKDDWCTRGLFQLYRNQNQIPKLLATLRAAISWGVEDDSLFYDLENDLALWQDKEHLHELESLLLEFAERLAKNNDALRLRSAVQTVLGRTEAALETLQRAINLQAEAKDYSDLAKLFRVLHRYEEAAMAAQASLKLDKNYYGAHFHLACAYAQLGRKQEAIRALRQYENAPMRLMSLSYQQETDLQPIAEMPEFKELTNAYPRETSPPIRKKPRRKS